MAGNNRVFPCFHSKTVNHKQKFYVIFISIPTFKTLLVLLLFYCNLNSCFTPRASNTIFCSAYFGNTFVYPAFVRPHASFAKVVVYTISELLKRIPLGIICLVGYKHLAVKHHLFLYTYLCIWCLICNTLHMQ